MRRYPKSARSARLKCIDCNAPVVETVDDAFVCVECGEAPIESTADRTPTASTYAPAPAPDDGRLADGRLADD